MSIIKNYTAFINENTEGGKKVFNLYHVKALSPSDNEMVLSDKSGNTFYIYKKEEDSDIWVLYDTDTSSGKIKPTTSHRMSKIIVNILDSTNKNKVNAELDSFYKNIPTKALEELVEYWSNKKMMWNSKEIKLSKEDISKLKEVQFYINKYYPKFNSKFNKKEH